ncbi:MAG: hypothetical protein ABW173_05770 [Sphingomonas sp.]
MTPEQAEALARTRFAILSAARASGVVLMLFGLWIWYGDLLDTGGNARVGSILFVAGFAESLVLPQILVRRWRTPPRP